MTSGEAIRAFRLMLLASFRSRATDLHVEPRMDNAAIRLRVDGYMLPAVEFSMSVFRRLIGVVMTGMGRDGTAGMAAIKHANGRTMAQDEDSSVIFGMPRAAIEAGVVDEVLSLEKLAGHLSQL